MTTPTIPTTPGFHHPLTVLADAQHNLTVSVAYLDDALNALRDRRDLLAILARAHGDIYKVALQLYKERVAANVTQEMAVLAHLAPDDPRLEREVAT